ncbi:hypothetical protein EJ08DRAFT_556286, partial [Tothia fuscella]
FRHEPLQHDGKDFRVLKILKSKSSAASNIVHCTIKNVNPIAAPSYKALSYCWGSPENPREIFMDGKLLTVGQNLYDFLLRQVQAAGPSDWLWIDQLCIDQSNTSERNHQVKLMGERYRNAQEVLIWLGGDREG